MTRTPAKHKLAISIRLVFKLLAQELRGGMSQSASQGSRVRDDSLLDIIRPVQSFQLSNCAKVDVSGEALLVVQRLLGVIRYCKSVDCTHAW